MSKADPHWRQTEDISYRISAVTRFLYLFLKPSAMRYHLFLPICLLLLTSCAAQNFVNGNFNASSSFPAVPIVTSSVPSFEPVSGASSSTFAVLPLLQALDTSYTTQKLGIAFRYPSSFINACNNTISVKVRENAYSIEFLQDPYFSDLCRTISDDHTSKSAVATIYAARVHNQTELKTFIDHVFPYDCVITEQSSEPGITHVFLQSKHPPTDAPDFQCGESISWDRISNVALFSPLGSKTGGGYKWSGSTPILMPDGSTEGGYDGPIMASIRFLPE